MNAMPLSRQLTPYPLTCFYKMYDLCGEFKKKKKGYRMHGKKPDRGVELGCLTGFLLQKYRKQK